MSGTHRPRKRFGQNFLHDPAVIERIIRSIHPLPGERLVEIGPGLGALTKPLLAAADELDVIELDRDVIPLLQQQCAGAGTLRVHNIDVLKFDFHALAEGQALRVVGNLPYNISTPLIFHLLKQLDAMHDMHFMVQKEVAERLAAAPDTEHYGRLSVMIQLYCAVEMLFSVGPGAFNPPPKVESSVVRLIPHRQRPVEIDDERRFADVVKRAFSQRRKTLRNAIKDLLTVEEITALGIDSSRRPETITLSEYAALSNAAARQGNNKATI